MKTRHFLFEAVKAHLRARNISYKDLANEIAISEQTVKRMFATNECSLERLDQICDLLHLDLRDLIVRATPRERKLIQQLTSKQEYEFAQNKKLLMIAVCVMGMWTFHDMVHHLTIEESECEALLQRLDEIGFIELRPHNRYRLLVSREFAWIADGPIMRMVKSMAGDYFNHHFDQDGEILKIINVRISKSSRQQLKTKLEQVTQAYVDQVSVDAHLPLHERPPLSICIAARAWAPEAMQGMFKA